MKREIKFRAWDGARMHHNVGVVDGKAHRRGCIGNILNPDTKAGTPMQFTGLHDKNGKEIYEGDIVTFYDFFCGKFHVYGGEWQEEYEDMNGEIIFDRGDFCIQHNGQAVITDAIPLSQIISHVNFEVIGNIYENPDLLNQQPE